MLPYVVRIIYYDFSVKNVYPLRSRDALTYFIKIMSLENVREVSIVPFMSNKVLKNYVEMMGWEIKDIEDHNKVIHFWEIGKNQGN